MNTNIAPPTPATLRKYGLTLDEWEDILDDQGGTCPICGKVPSSGRFVIDHEHVRGWKKLPSDERKRYVRGITCWFCNHSYLGRGINLEKARNTVAYLERYALRRPEL